MPRAFAVALLLAGLHPRAGSAEPARRLPRPVRGVVLGLHDLDPGRSYRRSVAEIAGTGANAVSILLPWRMAHVGAATVEPGPATRRQLAETVDEARRRGLAVLLAPTIQLEKLGPGEWRGTLGPPDWDAWFAAYRARLLDLASEGEALGAESLVVGSELCSSEGFEGRWRGLIAEVRSVFRGQLAYQANWDHRQAPRFLDALDYAAANAYFEVGRGLDRAGVDELVRAWEPYRRDLVAWARAAGRPLLLTEIGYPSMAGGSAFPWDYTRQAPADGEEQRRAYQAMFRVWRDEPALVGMFVYDWWGEGGPADRGYTPRGKPAAVELEAGFRALGRRR